ncbi:Sec1-like protein [Hamiltosporidium magnivora]|uniref:Sec1-like protein n=1 Tax=Hamiltosporidium magnivora TaxID=148818 RepID=A0A4Q9KVZ5_9MICR|nr:Sec1-like protein [Hamiltosporidium magnivora]
MDIKTLTKQKIITEVIKHGHSKDEWRVMIIDEYTASIITNVFTISEILSYNIISLIRIEEKEKPNLKEFSVIYFVKITETSIKSIKKDFKKKSFKSFYVITANEITSNQLNKIDLVGPPEISIKQLNFSFVPYESRVFIVKDNLFDGIKSFSNIFDISFNVCYTNDLTKDIAFTLNDYFETQKKKNYGNLIILDRSVDLYTPLLHYYTFQAILHDFKFLVDNFYIEKEIHFEESDKLWTSIRHGHIAEINNILSEKAKILVSGIKKLEKDIDIKDLAKIVAETPENLKLKSEVEMFLELLDKSITKFELDNLPLVSDLEQSISTRYTKSGNKYREAINDFFDILKNPEIRKHDKLRLYLLLLVSKYTLEKNEEQHIIDKGWLSKSEINLKNKIKKMTEYFIIRKELNREIKYDISRYQPILKDILYSFHEKKKCFINIIGCKEDSATEEVSLRQGGFVFKSNNGDSTKKKKVIVVYFIGGVTFAEIAIAYDVSSKLGIEIIVGSDQILTPESFLDNIIKK